MSAKQGIFLRKDDAAKTCTIEVVGIIGWDVWFGQMREMIRGIPAETEQVIFEIYSPGGDVWEGNGIVNDIAGMKQKTVARVQVAASMATMIALACKEREIAGNGRWLIHNPWTAIQGDADALEKRAKELRDCEAEAAEFYAARTGQKVEAMIDLMAEERWLTPKEAQELGFVQKVNDPFDQANYAAIKSEIVAAGKWPVALATDEPPKAKETTMKAEVIEKKSEQPSPVEPPKKEDAPAKQEQFECECIECGAVKTSEQHCKDLKCEKCGGQMRRKERPGPGQEKAKEEGKKNDDAVTTGAARAPAEKPVVPAKPADVAAAPEAAQPVKSRDYERGKADAKADCELAFSKQLADLTEQVAAREKLIRKLQSEKDILANELAAAQKDMDARETELNLKINDLVKGLKDANERHGKLLAGGMTFAPAEPESWEEAMHLSNGDYAACARKYPKLRDEFNKRKARK